MTELTLRDVHWRGLMLTLAVCGGVAVAFLFLGVPAAFVSGSMVGGMVLLTAGRRVVLPDLLREAGMLFCGLAMGATITPEMVAAFGEYPVSLLLLAVGMAILVVVTQVYLVRVEGFDRVTAFFSSVPGALSAVLATAADMRVDMNRVAVVQSVRLFCLVAILPPIVVQFGGAAVGAAPSAAVAPLKDLLLMAALGLSIGLIALRIGMAAPMIFGGMAGAATLQIGGFVSGSLHPALTNAAFLLVGVMIASRFGGLTRRLVVPLARASMGALVVALAIAAFFAWLASLATGRPFAEALVAFAPGGLEAMMVLGIALGLDPLYVGAHHLLRFMGIGLLAPLVPLALGKGAGAVVPQRDNSSTDVKN
jgi:uncharacterized protein